MFPLSAVFRMLVRNASPRGPKFLRCLMLSLSGPCELLFLLCFIAFWTCVVVRVMRCPCSLRTDLSIDLYEWCVACVTVFVNCFVKQFTMCFGEPTGVF